MGTSGGGSRTVKCQFGGTGGGPRDESRGPEAHWSGRGAGERGLGRAASKETERAILLYFGFLAVLC